MLPKKPTLYLETTIPSYLAARPSRDLIVAARQQITHEWWDYEKTKFSLYTSSGFKGNTGRRSECCVNQVKHNAKNKSFTSY